MKPREAERPSKVMEPSLVDPGGSQGGPDGEERIWLARARQGDRAAFRELVERHRDRAYGLALRIVRSPADAEEVAQDAFVRAWRGLPRFRGESSFGTWLHRIVARLAIDSSARLRRRGAREVALEEAAERRTATETLDDGGPDVERLVQGLSEAQRVVVALYYQEDRSVADVARALGIPENTVKTHLSRARRALRAAWNAEEGQ